MKYVEIHNQTRPQQKPLRAGFCATFICRLRGLMFRRHLAIDESLLLVQARDSVVDASIHMMFVFFNLAVVWINNAGEVVDVRLARQWQPAYLPQKPARFVLEMHASRIGEFQIGDQVQIKDENQSY